LSGLPLYYYLKQTLGNPIQSIASAKNGQTSEDKDEGMATNNHRYRELIFFFAKVMRYIIFNNIHKYSLLLFILYFNF
jgi:hypothetical protein